MENEQFKPRVILRYPEFDNHYKNNSILGFKKAYSFIDIDGISWYQSFFNHLIEARDQKKYLPVYRMGDGEYNFLLGRNIFEIIPFSKLSFRQKLTKLKMLLTRKRGHKSGAKQDIKESYTPDEYYQLYSKYLKDLQFIASNGVLALGLDTGDFYGIYMPYVKDTFDTHSITLNKDNYYHVYHVYALFGSSDKIRLVKGKNILIITSLNPEKERKLCESLTKDGALRIDFYPISATKAMMDIIDLKKINNDIDMVFIGAGVGAANILKQLEPLSVPCLDIGSVLSNMESPERIYDRPYMANDEKFDLEKINFFSKKQKDLIMKSLKEN